MAATPKELSPAFHFSGNQKKTRIWQARPGKLFRVCGRNLATFSDTWHILESGCLRSLGRGRRGKTDIFSRWRSDAGCRLVQRQQVQHFRVLPTEQTISFRETSGSSLHLVKLGYLSFLQPSAEEKCLYFEIPAWINHEFCLMSMPDMCWYPQLLILPNLFVSQMKSYA